jgi:hypothetical protein
MPVDSQEFDWSQLPIGKQLERLSLQALYLAAYRAQLGHCESKLQLLCTSIGLVEQLDRLPVELLRRRLNYWSGIVETCEFLGGDLEREATHLRVMLEKVTLALGPEKDPSNPEPPPV